MHSRKISYEDSCCCNRTPQNEVLVAVPGCNDDAAAVAALPDQWEPSRSGPTLANYLKKRESDHHRVLKILCDEAARINADVDANVRVLAENLLYHIKQNEKDMDCIVEQCDVNESPLPVESRDEALKELHKLYTSRVDDIARFKREAMTLERERADGVRKLLRDHFQRLVAVGHQAPTELLHDFDERMYGANQQLLSNMRAYTELEAQLRAHADINVVRTKSALNQLSLGIAMSFRRSSARSWTREQKKTQKRSSSAITAKSRESTDPVNQMLDGVEVFEECVSLLVEAYRTAVFKVFSGFSGKLLNLREDMGKQSSLEFDFHMQDMSELRNMVEHTLGRLSRSFTQQIVSSKCIHESTVTDARRMQKSLANLGDRLRQTYSILHDAGHLWDPHIMRSAHAQKLTIAAVEDLLTSNDAIELSNEILFNVALEQLRCCSEPDKLQQQYDAILIMLSRISDMYLQHSEAELGRLEEFMKLPLPLAETLLAEFACFLEKHPRSPPSSSSKGATPLFSITPKRDSSSINSPLPRAILQTELQGAALLNWQNGFLESFGNNVSLVPEELTRQARAWLDEKATALNTRYSLKMMSHSVRMERVKAAQELRLAELRFHEARLNSHLEAIFDLGESLIQQVSEFLTLDSPQLYPLCEWLDKIQVNLNEVLNADAIDPEVKRLKMCSYVARLIKHRALFEESLDTAIGEYKKLVEQRVQAARISNVRFVSCIKLLGEGGRYGAQEAVKTTTALVRASDSLEICVNKTFDTLNYRRSQLLALADQRMAPLSRVVDDFAKPIKGVGGKKPPPPGKKK